MHYDRKHDPEAQEWYYHMMNDPNQWEKFRYTDTIDDYNSIIEQFQKMYEQTPTTDHIMRDRIQSGLQQSKRELAKTLAEYDRFKQYKARTAISE